MRTCCDDQSKCNCDCHEFGYVFSVDIRHGLQQLYAQQQRKPNRQWIADFYAERNNQPIIELEPGSDPFGRW